MIRLNLQAVPRHDARVDELHLVSLSTVERDVARVVGDLETLLRRARETTVLIPSDVLFHAAATLMPPERMAVIGGRPLGGTFTLGTTYDVTGAANRAHVRADQGKLREALLGYQRADAALAGWAHSHPGCGPEATAPSGIDRDQYRDLARDYGANLVGLIVVRDGFVRLWGDAIESGAVRAEIAGLGVKAVRGHANVYRLAT